MVRALIIYFFMTAALAAAQGPQTFTGTVTDSMCAQADHAQMRMGSTDAGCLRRSLLIRPPLVVRTSMRAAATRPRQCRRSPQTRAE